MVAGAGESGGDEHGADFVAVQSGRVRLVVQAWSTNMHGWGAVEESFFDGVLVQTGDRAQSPGDRCARPTTVLEVAGERFDVCAGDGEQSDATVVAPLRELAQVQRVRVTSEAGVAAQEPCQGSKLDIAEHVIGDALQRCRGCCHSCGPSMTAKDRAVLTGRGDPQPIEPATVRPSAAQTLLRNTGCISAPERQYALLSTSLKTGVIAR